MKRWRLILILIAVVLLSCAALVFIGPKEPSYQGKTLTQWLYTGDKFPLNYGTIGHYIFIHDPEAIAALKQIGTNALPTLLRMMQTKDGSLKRRAIGLLNSQKLIHFNLRADDEKREVAQQAFFFLGTNALPAVPDLIKLTESKDGEVRHSAVLCLMNIRAGEISLLRVLERSLHDSNVHVRYSARSGILRFYPEDAERLGLANPAWEQTMTNLLGTNLPAVK